MRALSLAFVGIVFTALSGIAQEPLQQINVMRFENFAQAGTGLSSAGACIRESGMIISTLSAEGMANDFVTWRTNDSYFRGSAAVANSHSYGTTVLSRTNGAVFDFLGLDMTGFQPYQRGTVVFYGFRGFDFVACDSFAFAAGNFQTFRTSRLTNVTEIRWEQSASATPQFDNITVAFDTNLPMAQPVIHLRHKDMVILDIAGLMVNASYVLEYSSDSVSWISKRTFSSSSTINFPGFLSSAIPPNRFYRVRGL